MTDAERYIRAMTAGCIDACIRIEQAHGLFGYPPEIVCVGLRAADEGRNVDVAVAEYIAEISAEDDATPQTDSTAAAPSPAEGKPHD